MSVPNSRLHICAIPSCTSEAREAEKFLTWHTVHLANDKRRKAWLELFRRLRGDPEWVPSPHAKICSRHFPDNHFSQPRTTVGMRSRFTVDAFPTLYLEDERPEEVVNVEVKESKEKDPFGEEVKLECHEVSCPKCLHQFSFFLPGSEDENYASSPRKRPKMMMTDGTSGVTAVSRSGWVNQVTKICGEVEKDPLTLEEDCERLGVSPGIPLVSVVERAAEEHNYTQAQSQRPLPKFFRNARGRKGKRLVDGKRSPAPSSCDKQSTNSNLKIISVESLAPGFVRKKVPPPIPLTEQLKRDLLPPPLPLPSVVLLPDPPKVFRRHPPSSTYTNYHKKNPLKTYQSVQPKVKLNS